MKDIIKNFIVFEGLDGAGTTTQMKLLVEEYDRRSIPCKATFEPTAHATGALVRSILKKEIITTPYCCSLLFAADREDHLNNPLYGIKTRIKEGKTVICDRYMYSSFAYQGQEVPIETVKELNRTFPHPEYVIYIDTPIDECMARITSRGEEKELFEKRDFLNYVRKNYETEFTQLPAGVNFIRIDGSQSIEDVHREICAHLSLV